MRERKKIEREEVTKRGSDGTRRGLPMNNGSRVARKILLLLPVGIKGEEVIARPLPARIQRSFLTLWGCYVSCIASYFCPPLYLSPSSSVCHFFSLSVSQSVWLSPFVCLSFSVCFPFLQSVSLSLSLSLSLFPSLCFPLPLYTILVFAGHYKLYCGKGVRHFMSPLEPWWVGGLLTVDLS